MFKYCFYLPLLFLLVHATGSRAQAVNDTEKFVVGDTIFYTKNWTECAAKDHEFFRLSFVDSTSIPQQKCIRICDFYKNGVLQMSGFISPDDGKRVGVYKYFDKKGRLESVKVYDYASHAPYADLIPYQQHIPSCEVPGASLYITLFRDGHVRSIGFGTGNSFCDGAVGTWKFYNRFDHDIFTMSDFHKGLLHGRSFLYYSNGFLKKERYYKYGAKSGTWKTYNNNGIVKKVAFYGN